MKRTLPLVGIFLFAFCGTLVAADGTGMNAVQVGSTIGSITGFIVGLYVLAKTIG